MRARIAFYGSTPAYWPVLDLHGLGDLGRKLNTMSKQGQWAEISAEERGLVCGVRVGRQNKEQRLSERVAGIYGGLSEWLFIPRRLGMHTS